MKTGEMIKELAENPEKKFKNKDGDIASIESYFLGNIIVFHNLSGMRRYNYTLFAYGEWEEVKKAVSWEKAFNYMFNGEKAKFDDIIYHFDGSYLFNNDNLPAHMYKSMFIDDKWYLLD